ncbi:MAG: hypothetical protein AAF985_24055 [Bacteroidota bacterium]
MENWATHCKFILLLFIIGCGCSACSDVFPEDLADENIVQLAPANGLVTAIQTHTFWWEANDDADTYLLQIVSPSFDSIVQLIEEVEITEGLTYETVLGEGTYQWAVLGVNSVSQTARSVFDLTIVSDSLGDLSQQSILLISPEDNLVTKETEIDFLWQTLGNVDTYHFQLASPDFSNSSFILADSRSGDDFFLATLSEGAYQWRVRGENDLSFTPYSLRSLMVDLTEPEVPILSNPVNGDSLSLPTLLSWNRDVTASSDSLFIYPDSLVSPPIVQLPLSLSSYTFNNQPGNQFYFWRVKSMDQAGNESAFSSIRKFYVLE